LLVSEAVWPDGTLLLCAIAATVLCMPSVVIHYVQLTNPEDFFTNAQGIPKIPNLHT